MILRGIYKIPSVRHAFFIVSSLQEFSEHSLVSQENKKRREYFAHTLLSRDRKHPKVAPQWKLKVMSENDFLSVLRRQKPIRQVSSNRSSDYPEELELLAINLLRNSENDLDWTSNTPKVLSVVPGEDIIEVFI